MVLAYNRGNVGLQRPTTVAKQDIGVCRCLASDCVPTGVEDGLHYLWSTLCRLKSTNFNAGNNCSSLV